MQMQSDLRESFARRRRRPLVLEVRDEIERIILEGEVEAGERLNEIRLAEQLGVSRGPVREAARSLEREGLVETVANQGVYVRKLSIEDAVELYDLRAMLAGYLCAEVASRGDPVVAADLRRSVVEMDAAITRGDEAGYFELNLAFHDRIADAAGTHRTRALYMSLGKEVRLMRLRVLSGDAALAVSNAEHDGIVSAIERGDAEAARTAGADHHLNGKTRLLQTL
jgi:DNA-binding GntR family transcriptional regulator